MYYNYYYTCNILYYYSDFMQSCNSFPNCVQLLPRIRMGFVHNYSLTHARILGNDCSQFGSCCKIA